MASLSLLPRIKVRGKLQQESRGKELDSRFHGNDGTIGHYYAVINNNK